MPRHPGRVVGGGALMELRKPEWRTIAGFPDYDVSRSGRIRSRRHGKRSPGRRRLIFLQPGMAGNGYLTVNLWGDAQRAVTHSVHRLVLEAFVGPRPAGFDGSHLDGDRMNNAATNLVWESRAANMARAMVHDTVHRGETHAHHKLTAGDVKFIRATYTGERGQITALASVLHVHRGTIADVVHGRTWRRS